MLTIITFSPMQAYHIFCLSKGNHIHIFPASSDSQDTVSIPSIYKIEGKT